MMYKNICFPNSQINLLKTTQTNILWFIGNVVLLQSKTLLEKVKKNNKSTNSRQIIHELNITV